MLFFLLQEISDTNLDNLLFKKNTSVLPTGELRGRR